MMAILKCKMCGGDLTVNPESTVCECEYCGSKQTVPTADNEKKMTLFTRANRLRYNCDFDKASSVYEAIVADFPDEAEAYWGLVLSKYGIEYVDDPLTAQKVPTCHRLSFDSVIRDNNFELVMETADLVARNVYREQAKQIENIRSSIIEVSENEEPYDIFICYKETDALGQRTIDSVVAQDVYDALTSKGYRTFFSRVSLEDKLGQEYEPYIFAALNSAKVMLAFGTSYDNFNAVWVKNEWSRYLKLMTVDKDKHLIPCYKNVDVYDMPKEFSRLQAQDMGKVGAIQDLLRGIDKLIKPKTNVDKNAEAADYESAIINVYLQRGQIALEDGEWEKAYKFFDGVLNKDPKNSDAYLGQFLSDNHTVNFKTFVNAYLERTEKVELDELCVVEENDRIFNEVVEKYCIDNYKTLLDIRYIQDGFDRYIQSETVGREEHLSAFLSDVFNNTLINRAIQFAENSEIEDIISSAITTLEMRLNKSIEMDKINTAQKKNDYKEFWAYETEQLDEELKQYKSAETLVDDIANTIIYEMQSRYSNLQEKIDELENQKGQLNKELGALGMFKSGKKAELTKKINSLNQEIIRMQNEKAGLRYFNNMNPVKVEEAIFTMIDVNNHFKNKQTLDIFINKYGSLYNHFRFSGCVVGNKITIGSYKGMPISWYAFAEASPNCYKLISEKAFGPVVYESDLGRQEYATWAICELNRWIRDVLKNELFSEYEQLVIPEISIPDTNTILNIFQTNQKGKRCTDINDNSVTYWLQDTTQVNGTFSTVGMANVVTPKGEISWKGVLDLNYVRPVITLDLERKPLIQNTEAIVIRKPVNLETCAVLNCRVSAGEILSVSNLEEASILPKLIKAGLVNIPNNQNILTREDVARGNLKLRRGMNSLDVVTDNDVELV